MVLLLVIAAHTLYTAGESSEDDAQSTMAIDVSEFTKFNSLEEAQAEIRESFREQELAAAAAAAKQAEADKQAEAEDGRREGDKAKGRSKLARRFAVSTAPLEPGGLSLMYIVHVAHGARLRRLSSGR